MSTPESSSQKCPNCAGLENRVAELETQVHELLARLKQNSSNSSRPPSSDAPWIRRPAQKPSGRKPGGQAGHGGAFRQRLPAERVNQVVHHLPTHCGNCHVVLGPQAKTLGEPSWHQVAELPPLSVIITEHQAHARICTGCGHSTRAELPEQVRAYAVGPRLAAVMSYLSGRCQQSRRKVQELLQTIFNIPISLGTVCTREKEMSAALLPAYEQIALSVRDAPYKYVDETGWSKAGALCWLWAAAHKTAALFQIHDSRGKLGFSALLPRSCGVLVSDRWHAYSQVPLNARQVCWAHLKRDFQKLADFGSGAEHTGRAGLKVVKEVFGLWHQFKTATLGCRAFQNRLLALQGRLKRMLQRAARGHVKKAARFSRRILKCYDALWTFARTRGVEPTNNHVERALRPAVLWRKNSMGSHSDSGCRFVERMLTVVQTLRLQERPILQYLEDTLRAHRSNNHLPICIGN